MAEKEKIVSSLPTPEKIRKEQPFPLCLPRLHRRWTSKRS